MRLCLNMIVKNEIANLDRCLRSMVGVIDCWCIADTGSTDGTQEFIRQFFSSRGLPGLLVEIPFHHFAQARNEALDACRGSDLYFDYILLADADMEISVEDPLFKQGLSADIYMVIQRTGISYYNHRILRRTIPSCYRGVTHEFLEASGSVATLESISFVDHASGSNRKDKFARDIRLLLRALDKEGDAELRARYTFYLAQSYRDNGQMEKAITAYQRRAAMGGWDEEVWYSLYQVARLQVLGRAPAPTIVAAFEQAYEARPTRAEPLCDLAEYLRNNNRYALAHLMASQAKDIRRPSDILFIRDDVYAWRSLDEFAISAYWVGDFVSSAEACRALLASTATPAGQHGRIRENLRFALARIEQQAVAAGG